MLAQHQGELVFTGMKSNRWQLCPVIGLSSDLEISAFELFFNGFWERLSSKADLLYFSLCGKPPLTSAQKEAELNKSATIS